MTASGCTYGLTAGAHFTDVRSVTYLPEGWNSRQGSTIPAVDQNAGAWAIKTITSPRYRADNR